MPIIRRIKRCVNCGSLLQTANPDYPGYIDATVLEEAGDKDCLCRNCTEGFKKYSNSETGLEEGYYKIISEIKNKNALVVYVLDLYSFEGTFLPEINEDLKDLRVLAVGNKRDLLPSYVDDNELLEYVRHRLRVAKLDVVDAILTDTVRDYNINLLIEKIKEYGAGKDVYLVGASVSGKSALIQTIIKNYHNDSAEPIVTHTFKGTSFRGFKIPLNKSNYLFEAPGLPIESSILTRVESIVGHYIIPESEVAPRSYKIKQGDSIIFGGLCIMELIKGKEMNVDVFASHLCEVKASSDGESLFASALKKGNIRPRSKNLNSFADFDVYDLEVTEEGHRDLGVTGLGWIHFIADKQVFRVFVPKGVGVYTSRSKIKNVNKQTKNTTKTRSSTK